MKKLLERFRVLRTRRDDAVSDTGVDDGASAVEYGLLVALIAVVIAVAVGFLGSALTDQFTEACQDVGGPAAECEVAPPGP